MPTNLYFTRHAHSVYTPEELTRPLSVKGFSDAIRVTNILMKENIDAVISSPYKRAIQTVEGVAEYIGKEITIKEGFKERILSEESVEDFPSAIAKVWEDNTFSWAGGESNIIAQKRGVQETLTILDQYKGKNVVIGTHGNIMVLTMNYFDEKYGFSFWKELDMPDIYKLTFYKTKLLEVNRVWARGVLNSK